MPSSLPLDPHRRLSSLLDNINNALKKLLLHLSYTPDQPGACRHSRPSGGEDGKQKKLLALGKFSLARLYEGGHTSLPPPQYTPRTASCRQYQQTINPQLTTISAPRASGFQLWSIKRLLSAKWKVGQPQWIASCKWINTPRTPSRVLTLG